MLEGRKGGVIADAVLPSFQLNPDRRPAQPQLHTSCALANAQAETLLKRYRNASGGMFSRDEVGGVTMACRRRYVNGAVVRSSQSTIADEAEAPVLVG